MINTFIFDLNGTVLSDEDEYGKAFAKVLTDLGAKVEEDFPHVSGIGVSENWPMLLAKYEVTTDKSIAELTQKTQEYYKNSFSNVTLKPGVQEFLENTREKGYLCALATSNTYGIVEMVFEKFELESLFDMVTTAEEVEENKPNPEIFIHTAIKLDVNPSDCVVFEDSVAGITAALSAGMYAVGVARDEEYADFLKDADKVVRDFTEISVSDIISLENERE